MWSFREASMAQRKIDDAIALAAYQDRLANGPKMSAWNGVSRLGPDAVSPAYKAVSSTVGMVSDFLGVVAGGAMTVTGVTLTGTPEPTTLTKWAGVPLTAYGAAYTTKSVVGFGLNAKNFYAAITGATSESAYVPGSALEAIVRLSGGSPEAERAAVAADMAWGLATGRVLDARLATGVITNPKAAALLQPPLFTTVGSQATFFAPNAWNSFMRFEPRVGVFDLGFKVNDNVVQPLRPTEIEK